MIALRGLFRRLAYGRVVSDCPEVLQALEKLRSLFGEIVQTSADAVERQVAEECLGWVSTWHKQKLDDLFSRNVGGTLSKGVLNKAWSQENLSRVEVACDELYLQIQRAVA
jgi:hypothetical protein